MNKKHIILSSLLILTIGIVVFNYANQLGALFAEATAPNPGHSWSELECTTDLCINATGVGIGTASPGVKLDVAGVIRGTGLISNPTGETQPTCDSSTEGMQWYDYTDKDLLLCDGTDWINIASKKYYFSCAELFDDGFIFSGTYNITVGASPQEYRNVVVYCDMLTDGGGWTLVRNSPNNDDDTALEYPIDLGQKAFYVGTKMIPGITEYRIEVIGPSNHSDSKTTNTNVISALYSGAGYNDGARSVVWENISGITIGTRGLNQYSPLVLKETPNYTKDNWLYVDSSGSNPYCSSVNCSLVGGGAWTRLSAWVR